MANIINFQPVIFDESLDACLANTNGFSMPVLLGDNTQFQFSIDACSSASDIVDNGTFASSSSWVVGTNWTIASNTAYHTAGASGNLYQAVPFSSSGYYKIIVTVSNMTSGSLTVKVGLTVKGTITANGTYEYWQSGPVFGTGLTFAASSDCQADINYVSVLYMNKYMKVVIYDASDNSQAAILENADGYFDFQNQYWTTTINWGALGLSYGCYYIGVADECTNTCSQLYLAGQDFYEESFWTEAVNNNATTTLILLNNVWLYESTSVVGTGTLTANYAICSGRTYVVTYTLSGLAGNATATIKCGTSAGTTRSANGTYTDTIVSNGTTFSINFASSTNPSNFWISAMTVTGIDAELTTNYTSNRFLYTDNVNCSHMITMVCDENSFGMGFVNTGFIPRARIESKLILSGYPQSRVITKTSQGVKRVDFFEADKNWRLKVIRQPEHIMDFLSLLIGADHWYIDDVEYFASEDEFAEPKSNKWFNLYDIDIECQKKTLLLQNKNCSDNKEEGVLSQAAMESYSGQNMTTGSGIQMTIESKQ